MPCGLLSHSYSTPHAPRANRQSQKSDAYGSCLTHFVLIDSFLLRQTCTACTPIFALVDPTSDDVFFVNSELLALKLSEEATSSDISSFRTFSPTTILKDTTLVLLDERLRTLESLPEPLLSLLLHLHSILLSPTQEGTPQQRAPSLPYLVSLPSSDLRPSVQVPLAGILLDYSVAYVPLPQLTPEHNEAYLGGEALDVYEFRLQSSKTGESYVKSSFVNVAT